MYLTSQPPAQLGDDTTTVAPAPAPGIEIPGRYLWGLALAGMFLYYSAHTAKHAISEYGKRKKADR